MPEESSRHHHHRHSSGSHKSGRSSNHRSRRHARHRGIDATHEMQRAFVDEILSQNIGMLLEGLHRKVLFLAITGLVAAGAIFFLGWSRPYEGSLLRASIASIVFLSLWFVGVKLFQIHKASVIDLKALVQFQETRVDALKVSLAQRDKAIQEMAEQIRQTEPENGKEGDSGEQDYRRLSGLS